MRVCIVPEYPASLMTGGTLVQAVETRKALAKYAPGMSFELFNWSDAQAQADCYHFIGMPKYLAGICALVARSRRPYVVTLLMGSPEPGRWGMAAWRRRAGLWLGRNREHQLAIEQATTLIAITPNDAAAIADTFRIPKNRIQVVPVAVSAAYFETNAQLWRSEYGQEPFVLCVGAIQQRKNQLLLAKICNELRLALVLVGSSLPGEDAYAEEVRSAMTENQKLGGRWLRCDDKVLASAYAACKIFVLLSAAETQPASVLQAMALQKPVLLANAPYAKSYPFDHLPRADTKNESEVKLALTNVWRGGFSTFLPEEFTEPQVCKLLASIYSSALTNGLQHDGTRFSAKKS